MKLPGDIDLAMAVGVWRRNVTVYRHTWLTNILPNFFDPLLYLLGIGMGLGMFIDRRIDGHDYIAWIAPGLMAAAAMNGASFEVTWNMFIRMNFARIYDAYLATPATIQDVAFGELLWAMSRALLYGLAFFAVLIGFTLAGKPILTSPWAALVPLALALVGGTFALLGQLYTSMIRVIDLYGYYWTLFITPSFLFSGIFFPLEGMAYGWGERIAWCTPLYHGVRLVRGLSHGVMTTDQLVSTVWLLALCAALMWAVPRRMRKRMMR